MQRLDDAVAAYQKTIELAPRNWTANRCLWNASWLTRWTRHVFWSAVSVRAKPRTNGNNTLPGSAFALVYR